MRILVIGALGEVGNSVSAALTARGHEVVPVSARAPLADRSDVVSLTEALRAISGHQADLVLNCSGRGDRRASDRSGVDTTECLGDAVAASGIPGVLLSTTRVLEGHSGDFLEDANPLATTPYATANAINEAKWLASAGARMHVLRITNYFCSPQAINSPQAQLLPWSLVTEALETGSIVIRSGAALTKEFVSADDVARAVTLLAADSSAPPVCATVPGAALSLGELASATLSALERVGRTSVQASFGPDGPPGPNCRPGWLATVGWRGLLTPDQISEAITSWILINEGTASGNSPTLGD